jgi:hypothetical protein
MKALVLTILVVSTAAPAASHRIAVVVGANRGALGRPDLRYSYCDAQDVAETLIQVGEFKPDDVHVLHDPSPAVVLGELDRELATLRADRGESLLVFYYSGHADGAALYPGGQRCSTRICGRGWRAAPRPSAWGSSTRAAAAGGPAPRVCTPRRRSRCRSRWS